MGIILAVFHVAGRKLCLMESFKKLVRYCIAWGSKFLRWKFDMLSVPVDCLFLSCFMACFTSSVVNGSGRLWCISDLFADSSVGGGFCGPAYFGVVFYETVRLAQGVEIIIS